MFFLTDEMYREVIAVVADVRPDLAKRLSSAREHQKNQVLTSRQAAEVLGVSSANTVKNWLEGGHFRGAYRTAGGHWRFPLSEVMAAKLAMERLNARNQSSDLAPSEVEDDYEAPLL